MALLRDISVPMQRFMLDLRDKGILDTELLRAVEKTPREIFLPEEMRDHPYGATPVALEEGQEATPPLQILQMLSHLSLTPSMSVLEIGMGSGYQTALLARLTKRVYAIERRKGIAITAQKSFQALDIENIIAIIKDGAAGWEEQAPFDRIIANAAFRSLPPALTDQLKDGGVLLIPILSEEGEFEAEEASDPKQSSQNIFHITKQAKGLLRRKIGESHFPLLEEGPAGRPNPSY